MGSLAGDGTLTVSNGGQVNVDDGSSYVMTLASSSSATGTLNIGNGGGASILNVGSVDGGDGASTLNFNHTDDIYHFTDDGTANGSPIEVTGSLSVNHNGSGTTVLSGDNTYSFITNINDGTLQIGNGGTTGSINTDIGNEGNLTFKRSNRLVFDNSIIGSGSVTQAGSGTTVLTNANRYASGTNIDDGTLQIGDGGNTGSIEGDVANNGELIFNRSDDGFSLSGVISGTGKMTQTGTGKTTLTGNNSYSGGTEINNGTLQLGDGGASGSITGDVLNDGVLIFDRSDDNLSLNGVISGSGSLLQAGTGSTTLTGNNSYSGDTVINSGTLQLGDGGINGEINGNIENDGHLVFNRSDDNLSLDGIISGDGNMTQSGAGKTTLTGNNTYSGTTTVEAGTLQLEGGNAIQNDGELILENGRLLITESETIGSLSGSGGTVDLSSGNLSTGQRNLDSIFEGRISGDGALTKEGVGSMILTGDNSHTGDTTVNDGILVINGTSTDSTTIVNNDGTLGGDGTLGNVIIAGGTLSPGNSIGTISTDNVDFSGGIYEVEVNADGRGDKIIATGQASLSSGRVSVLPEAGNYAGVTNYTIIEAGDINGEFNSVSVDKPNFAFLDASLGYSDTQVSLRLQRNDIDFTSVANSPNTMNTANAITQSLDNNSLSDITNNLLILDDAGARQGFESLSGNQLSQSSTMALSASRRFGGLLNSRSQFLSSNPGAVGNFASPESMRALARVKSGNLNALSELPATAAGQDFTGGSGLWLTPQAGFGDIDPTSNARGTDYNYGGLAGGYDRWFDDSLLLGTSFGYSETRADDVEIDSLQSALYGRWLLDNNRYLDGSVSVGQHQNDSKRLVVVGNTFAQAEGDYDVDTRSVTLEFGQDFTFKNDITLTPFAGIDYTHLDRQGFTEKGAGQSNLTLDDDRQESLRSRLGLKVAKSFTQSSGRRWEVDASLAWAHEFADNTASTNAAFAAAPEFQFETAGPELNRDRAEIGLGVTTSLSDHSSVKVGYQGDISSTDNDNSAYSTFRFSW